MQLAAISMLLLLIATVGARAQSAVRGQFEVRGAAGYSTFIDESA